MPGSAVDAPNIERLPLFDDASGHTAAFIAIIRRLATSNTLPEVMEIITHAARTLVRADGITFVLRDGDLCYYAEEDAIAPLWKGSRFPIHACVSGWCMIHGKSVSIPDISKDDRVPQDAYRPHFVRSLAMVPVGQDKPVAALGAYWARERQIERTELDLLQGIANAAALAISHVSSSANNNNASGGSERNKLLGKTGAKAWASVWRRLNWLSEARDSSISAYLLAVLFVSVSLLIRLALGAVAGPGAAPFAPFLPAVLAATAFGGVAAGAFALILGAGVGWWALVPPSFMFAAPDPVLTTNLAIYLVGGVIIIWATQRYRALLRSLERREREHHLLARELQHRARNATSLVQAVVSRSLQSDPGKADLISRRVLGVLNTDGVTGDGAVTGLHTLVASALKAYGDNRVYISGAGIKLRPKAAKAFNLVVHELATNAVKYGAFSNPDGRVETSWLIADGHLTFVWEEHGGPALLSPPRGGFGSYMIKHVLSLVDGTIRSDWKREGAVHEIRIPSANHLVD